jgi:hypothetical protein
VFDHLYCGLFTGFRWSTGGQLHAWLVRPRIATRRRPPCGLIPSHRDRASGVNTNARPSAPMTSGQNSCEFWSRSLTTEIQLAIQWLRFLLRSRCRLAGGRFRRRLGCAGPGHRHDCDHPRVAVTLPATGAEVVKEDTSHTQDRDHRGHHHGHQVTAPLSSLNMHLSFLQIRWRQAKSLPRLGPASSLKGVRVASVSIRRRPSSIHRTRRHAACSHGRTRRRVAAAACHRGSGSVAT